MAATLKFGPEWLRQLSGGNNVASPSPSAGLGKFKLAEYRYGREEMLALFHDEYKAPDDLVEYPPVYVEESQKPLAFISLTEEEQRLMSQSVNSTTVLRTMGRGGPPMWGGRGGGDRGRGRGRGRGDGFPPRGAPFEQPENGVGLGRARGQTKDGWEEVSKKYDRSFPVRSPEEVPMPVRHPQFSRSLSSDNWREKGGEDPAPPTPTEDDGGEWRRAGSHKDTTSRWGTRTTWREPMGRDVPEWSVSENEDMGELGTFDSSGQFVTPQVKGLNVNNGDGQSSNTLNTDPSHDTTESKDPVQERRKEPKAQRPVSSPSMKQKSAPVKRVDRKTVSPQPHPVAKNIVEPVSPSEDDREVVRTTDEACAQIVDRTNTDASRDTNLKNVKHMKPVSGEDMARWKEKAESMLADAPTQAPHGDGPPQTPADVEVQSQALQSTHENVMKWFYHDPQGDVQGPFEPEEMAQWFSAGYFTMSLAVKRGCDERFQQLGELIKRWGRVPFLGGHAPPPLLNPIASGNAEPTIKPTPPPPSIPHPVQVTTTAPPPTQSTTPPEVVTSMQQQMIMQQLMQQQMFFRQMQVQMMNQMQEQESFQLLTLPQQQQMVMQMLMQTQPMFMQQMQQLQQLHQQQQQQPHRLSPQPQSNENYPRPAAESEGHVQQGNWTQPASIWDVDTPQQDIPAQNNLTQQQLQNKAEESRRRQHEEEEVRQVELQRTQEELKRQQEELARERENMRRDKEELERQRQIENQRLEEIHRREEEERRKQMEEENKRKDEQLRLEQIEKENREETRRRETAERRRIEEERKRQEEIVRKQEEQREQELQRQQQEEMRLQEIELQRQQDIEEKRRQEIFRQQELQRQQQQEALRLLQQQQREQLAHIQLPATAQWASSNQQRDPKEGLSMTEIQQEEERNGERQLELHRQQMIAIQQQQQQQQQQQHMQKSWGSPMTINQAATNTLKSLLDIQEEQTKQHDENKKKTKQVQASQAKQNTTCTLAMPSSWSNVASNGSQPAGWGGNTVWTTDKPPKVPGGGGGTGVFWDEAIISAKKSVVKETGDFPVLGGKKKSPQSVTSPTTAPVNRGKQSKPKREEDTVQKLFQSSRRVDPFTQWCEKQLSNLGSSVDVPTFIAFLQDVDSPYEVHDYVRSYLGESKSAKGFASEFLEKRSQHREKQRLERQQEEESIWGPAPAVNPLEMRANNNEYESAASKKSKKKKSKMQKMDQSILGFTVHADTTRVNAGEIENND